MERLIKAKRDAFDSACYAIKAIALFCCFYPLFEKYFDYAPQETLMTISMNSVITMLLMLAVVLTIWLVLQTNHNTKSGRKWLEILVFNGICFASVLVSGASNSNYKFLFLLPIVTYTIQYGVWYGIIVAGSASGLLLATDMLTIMITKQHVVNLPSDIALAFTFAITAYILGRYVKL